MIKLTFCLRRKEGMSLEAFQDYWLNHHGPLVRSHMQALNIRRYVQVHRLDSSINEGIGASRKAPEPYDGVAELWFDSAESIIANGQNEAAQIAGQALLEDERKFIDLENSPLWFNEENEIIALGENEPAG